MHLCCWFDWGFLPELRQLIRWRIWRFWTTRSGNRNHFFWYYLFLNNWFLFFLWLFRLFWSWFWLLLSSNLFFLFIRNRFFLLGCDWNFNLFNFSGSWCFLGWWGWRRGRGGVWGEWWIRHRGQYFSLRFLLFVLFSFRFSYSFDSRFRFCLNFPFFADLLLFNFFFWAFFDFFVFLSIFRWGFDQLWYLLFASTFEFRTSVHVNFESKWL
jgi:hypothetical protein